MAEDDPRGQAGQHRRRRPRRCRHRPARGGRSGLPRRRPRPRGRRGRPRGSRTAGRSPASRPAPACGTRWSARGRRRRPGWCSSSSWRQSRSVESCGHHARGARVIPRPTGPQPPPPGPGRDGRATPRLRRRMAGCACGGRSPRRRGAPGARRGPGPAGRRSGAGRGGRRSRTAMPRASRAAPPPRPGPSAAALPRRPSASRASIAASWRPAAATDRCRLADSALITRLSSPRIVRATLRASSSRSDALAPIRPRNAVMDLGALPGDDAVAAPDAPRRREPDVRQAFRARIGASSTVTTNSRWARPTARLSDPRARNRPRSQASRQCSAARDQSKGVSGRTKTRRAPGGPALAGHGRRAGPRGGRSRAPAT